MGKVMDFNSTKASGQIRTGRYAGMYRHNYVLTGTDALLSALESAENVLSEAMDDERVPDELQNEMEDVLEIIGMAESGKELHFSVIEANPGE